MGRERWQWVVFWEQLLQPMLPSLSNQIKNRAQLQGGFTVIETVNLPLLTQ
jgi:hypothetical protein